VPTLGLVIALSAEARVLLGPGRFRSGPDGSLPLRRVRLESDLEILCLLCGPGPARAERATRELAACGAHALACLGVSGGLSPELVPGELILADAVWRAAESAAPETVWQAAQTQDETLAVLRRAGLAVRVGPVLGADRPVTSPEAKLALHRSCGALAVDMESAAAARTARELGLPFLCLRAVCDPQSRAIPPEIDEVLDASGNVRLLAVLGRLIRRPSLFRELARMSRDFEAALAALGQAFRLLGREVLPGLAAQSAAARG
jgi:nucleoside phosphorylase